MNKYEVTTSTGTQTAYADRYEMKGTTANFYKRGSISESVEDVIMVLEQ